MLIILICALFGLVAALLLCRKDSTINNWEKGFLGIMGMGVGALMGILVVCMFSAFLGGRQIQQNEYERTEIVALIDSNHLSGAFFLASGSISQKECYKFYVRTPNGGKQFRSLPAENVIIYEENRQDAYISEIQEKRSRPRIKKIYYLLIPSSFIDPVYKLTGKYAVHVPNGTIKVEDKDFSIDMK